MGFTNSGVAFLNFAKDHMTFGQTLTIGRQSIAFPEALGKITFGEGYNHQPFCEFLLQNYFGATRVDSLDYSDYEGASIIHDMNLPIAKQYHEQFDTIIDGGSLEHIFNIVQAFENCSKLCRFGGQIIHMLPANNCCGHGFYQFSPELFFSLYSEKNGYRDTQLLIADVINPNEIAWQQIDPPPRGQRLETNFNGSYLYVYVRTTKQSSDFPHNRVQQSDYQELWKEAPIR